MWTYRATLLRWLDGDTASVRVDCGFRIYTEQTIRLMGLDTAELHSRDTAERARAAAAHMRAMVLLPPGADCTVATAKPVDRYGRWLGTLTTAGGVDVNAVLLAEGHARPYDGGARA